MDGLSISPICMAIRGILAELLAKPFCMSAPCQHLVKVRSKSRGHLECIYLKFLFFLKMFDDAYLVYMAGCTYV
jgi:hypothetical protein